MEKCKCEICQSDNWSEVGKDNNDNIIFECENGHIIYEDGSEYEMKKIFMYLDETYVLYITEKSLFDVDKQKLSTKQVEKLWNESEYYPEYRKIIFPYIKDLLNLKLEDNTQSLDILEIKCPVCNNSYKGVKTTNKTMCPYCYTMLSMDDIKECEITKTLTVDLEKLEIEKKRIEI